MADLGTQLRDYLDATTSEVRLSDVHSLRAVRTAPVPGAARLHRWVAGAEVPRRRGLLIAAAALVTALLIGLPLLFLRGKDGSPVITTEQTATVLTWIRIDDADVFGGPGEQGIYSVTAGGPGLVAAGDEDLGGESDAAVWVSVDGYVWTRIERGAAFGGPGYQTITSVTAGGPGLVAVGGETSGDDFDAAVWVSADGYAWTRIHDEEVFGGPGNQFLASVTAGGPGLVAVGHDRSSDGNSSKGAVWVSADGYAWTRIHDEEAFGDLGTQLLASVTAGGPGLVAVGSEDSDWGNQAAVWVSPDGYAWTRILNEEVFSALGYLTSVTAGGPGLVAVGSEDSDSGNHAAVCVSADGYAWTRILNEEVFDGPGRMVQSVTAGGPGLVMVGLEGSGNGWDGAVWVAGPSSTTTGPPPSSAGATTSEGSGLEPAGPDLTDDGAAVLEARAIGRACTYCTQEPVCVVESTPPELVAALERVFPAGVLTVEQVPPPGVTSTAPEPFCHVFGLGVGNNPPLKRLSEDVVGVDVWWGPTARTYWFHWDGSTWVDVAPGEVGVTETTAA